MVNGDGNKLPVDVMPYLPFSGGKFNAAFANVVGFSTTISKYPFLATLTKK